MDTAIDKAGDVVDQKTQGKYAQHVDKVQDAAKKAVDKSLHRRRMAKLSVSVDVPLPPEKAWECASDLSRFKEWLTIHRVWRSKLPETIEKGAVVESIVEVKGMPNRISGPSSTTAARADDAQRGR